MTNNLTNEELLNLIQHKLEENDRTLSAERSLITELNSVNERLIQSEDLKTNFLSNIRNEINNPLSAILEISKLISEGQIPLEAVQKYTALIYLEAFDLDFQLRNIFLSAEIEAGEASLQLSHISVQQFIEGIIKLFSKKAAKRGIEIQFENNIDSSLKIVSDSEKLNLIVSNLLANAIIFNKENGIVKLSAEFNNDYLQIAIKDDGIGIPENEISKIFDRFYQVDSGSTKTYGGHGLGLSITKALLEILQGEVQVKSNVNEGSEFTIKVKNLVDESNDTSYSSEANEFFFDDQDEDDMLF